MAMQKGNSADDEQGYKDGHECSCGGYIHRLLSWFWNGKPRRSAESADAGGKGDGAMSVCAWQIEL